MGKKIFMDTNIILDLYRGRTSYKDFKSLSMKRAFVTTRQVIDEFRRNKNNVISVDDVSVKQIKDFKELSFDKFKNILKSDEFEEIIKGKSEIDDKLKDIEKILNERQKNDQISIAVENLFSLKSTLIIDDSEECLNNARARYDLGRIPKSDDKPTLCDQYIWELLLSQNFQDLIFVSRDKTYQDGNNINLLTAEYKEKTNGNITIVSNLKDGLKVLEEDDEDKIEEIAKKSNDDYKQQSYKDFVKNIEDLVLRLNAIGANMQDSQLPESIRGLPVGIGIGGSYLANYGSRQYIGGMNPATDVRGSYMYNPELQDDLKSIQLGVGIRSPYWQNPEVQETIRNTTLEIQKTISKFKDENNINE